MKSTIKKKLQRSSIVLIFSPTLIVMLIGLLAMVVIYGISGGDVPLTHSSVEYYTADDAPGNFKEAGYEPVEGEVKAYKNAHGDYAITFENAKETPNVRGHAPYVRRSTFGIIILLAILLVYLINRHLVKKIYKQIVDPIDILANGVNEISNGNLEYRINYDGDDEFSDVCKAFNEMANAVLEMTERQKKEEQNRKELIAGISHDLRTPLTSIKAYVVGIENGIAKTPQMQQKYLATINQKAEELEHIINQLFMFSKLDIGEFPFAMEQVNLKEVLEQLILEMKDEYKANGVTLQNEPIPDNIISSIDVIQFKNIIQNIWSNTARYKDKEHATSTLCCKTNGQQVTITITDDGPGVPENAVDKLFDLFYRTDDSRQNVALGSGLGLAICSKIIQGFGGEICAKNVAPHGLTIELTLPLVNAQ